MTTLLHINVMIMMINDQYTKKIKILRIITYKRIAFIGVGYEFYNKKRLESLKRFDLMEFLKIYKNYKKYTRN